MKLEIKAVIVVEGKTDVAFLESFIKAQFVLTNGSDIPKETISYLQTLQKEYPIIVLTDPDSPGKRIRDILDQKIKGLIHVYLDKAKAIKKNKVGIAQAKKEDILQAFENIDIAKEPLVRGKITINDLLSLGITGKNSSAEIRQKIANKYQLGYITTAKEFLKRVNLQHLSVADLKKEMTKDDCE